jgi:pSer/pThr/pTyr-binding forkhead associated (FHA) protein
VSITIREIHPVRGHERLLAGGAVIGRGPDCDVRLDDPLVSRRHARILGSEVGTGIEDLRSSNGIYVNGRRSPGITPLHPGDVLQLGATVWMVLSSPAQRGSIELAVTA